MSRERILIIDDEEAVRTLLKEILGEAGYRVLSAANGDEALGLYQQHGADTVICDLYLPHIDGLAVMKRLHEMEPELPVIVLTGGGSVQTAIQAMRLGAYDYIMKPFNPAELVLIVQKALETRALKSEVTWLRDAAVQDISLEDIDAKTGHNTQLTRMVDKVAPSDASTILLEGESGTGKNLTARLIHFRSKRAHYPFMEINCASIPETLIESELFGHEKGSFTDAKQLKRGLFEVAQRGTILLDEIGEMSTATQAKLLHAIENRKFRRVGGVQDIDMDVRVIAATNINLKEAVTQKKFREDLYFRLQLIPIHIPPLRERREDIPILTEHFIKKFSQKYHKNFSGASPEAMVFLRSYSWPGNIRELKNVIERIILLENDARIDMPYLPQEIRSEGSGPRNGFHIPEQGINLEDVERDFIAEALEKTSGNQTRAAKLLGLTRHTLRYRMEKFHLP